jgi:hypothetical protein
VGIQVNGEIKSQDEIVLIDIIKEKEKMEEVLSLESGEPKGERGIGLKARLLGNRTLG